MVQIKQSAMEITSTRAVVTLPENDIKGTSKAVLYWFAYTTPKINPLITKSVEEIFAQQALTKPVCAHTHTPAQAHTNKKQTTSPTHKKTNSFWQRFKSASSNAG